MRKPPHSNPDNARPRADLGGYSPAQFDAAIARSQRSDLFSVLLRLLSVLVVFWLLARAIDVYGAPAWSLVLPLAVEFIAIFWIGFVLSRFVVDCKTFAKSAGSAGLLITWTVAFLLVLVAVAGIDPEPQGWRWQHIGAGVRILWHVLVQMGLHWVIGVSLLTLLVSTAFEVRRWRRESGVFVWTSIIYLGFRFGVMLLLGTVLGFAWVFLGDWLPSWSELSPRAAAWVVWTFLLLAELLTVAASTAIHRDALNKQGGNKAVADA